MQGQATAPVLGAGDASCFQPGELVTLYDGQTEPQLTLLTDYVALTSSLYFRGDGGHFDPDLVCV